MNGALILRFSILLAAGILFFESLNLFDDWTFQLMPVRFVGAALASGLAFLAAISHFPPKIDIRRQAILFWGIAILLRIIALPLVPADDLIRYQWEGKIQRAGYNPYLVTVSDPQLDNLRHDFPEAARINHPELHAFDAPGAESLFKFLSGITDRPLFYKIIFAMADLAVAAVLLCFNRWRSTLSRGGLVRLEPARRLQLRRHGAFRQHYDPVAHRRNFRAC
jgi:alpha-1,6-mannosyltransferase